jgi:hypothetical protein
MFRWEQQDEPDFPALRRVSVSGHQGLSGLPDALGARPFTRVVEALVDELSPVQPAGHPVALDPGGDLRDWESLDWFDSARNGPITVTTDAGRRNAVLVDTLRARAVEWGRPIVRQTPDLVDIDPSLVRLVGRSGGAFTDGSEQQVERDVDVVGPIRKAVAVFGVHRTSKLTGLSTDRVRNIAEPGSLRPSTVGRAQAVLTAGLGPDPLARLLDLVASHGSCGLSDCSRPVMGPGARWCSNAHRVAGQRIARATS